MRKVNLFLVGAPKCGTTALAAYLQQSEKVFVPKIKEPHFFCTDFENYRRVRSDSAYNALFPLNDASYETFCDASVWNLYSRCAAEQIATYNPDAKIIVMLRDPLEMLPSLHNQLVFSGREDLTCFDEAWNACGSRKQREGLPKNVLEPSHVFYDEVCKYSDQALRLLNKFPREQVKFILFEDFRNNPFNEVMKVFDFIAVNPPFGLETPVVNAARRHRFPAIAHFLQYPPFPLSAVKNALKKIPIIDKHVPLRGFYDAMSTKGNWGRPSLATRRQVRDIYLSEIEHLSQILDHSLSHWLSVDEGCEIGSRGHPS